MLASERQRLILRRVHETGGARVTELARELRVADETVRRDLERLDAEGKLLRTHGGAVPIDPDRELPYSIRGAANLPEKRAIARAALREISEGAVIALDASSSAVELARVLPDRPLTVITNSLAAANILAARSSIRVVSTGGVLDAASLSFLGSSAEDALGRFNINTLFFSSKGVDVARGLSVAADEHARIKRRMIDLAARCVLLADHSKFGVKSVVFFAELPEVDLVLTDCGTPQAIVDEISARAVAIERTETTL